MMMTNVYKCQKQWFKPTMWQYN